MDTIISILVSRGYDEPGARLMAERLSAIDTSLKQLLTEWLDNEAEGDFTVSGISLLELKKQFQMTYPAALLSMDWLIREPEKAKRCIEHGIK